MDQQIFALNYLTLNFTEVVMNANKVNPENLIAVRYFEKFTSINLWTDQSQHFKRSTVIGPSISL